MDIFCALVVITHLILLFSLNLMEEKVSCFNCNGYESAQSYVDDLIKVHDITFVSEHWLQQNEISL